MAQEARIPVEQDRDAHPSKIAKGGAASDEVISHATRETGSVAVATKNDNDSSFSVSVLDVYEGPLDLLLDLIRKQDIDIYDIPIAKITAQYLAYVERLKELKAGGAQIPIVQIYSASRPTLNPRFGHLSLRALSRIARRVRDETGLTAEIF